MGAPSPAWPGPSGAEDEAQRGDRLKIQQLPFKLLFCALHNISTALVHFHLPRSAFSKAIGHLFKNPQGWFQYRVWNCRMSYSLGDSFSIFLSGSSKDLSLKFYFSSHFLQSPFHWPVPAEDAQETGSPHGERARWLAWVPARFLESIHKRERGQGNVLTGEKRSGREWTE